MGNCGDCGAELLTDASYCIRCGRSVDTGVMVIDLEPLSPTGTVEPASEPDAAVDGRPELAGRARSWLVVLAVVAVVSLVGWLAVGGDAGPTEPTGDDDRVGRDSDDAAPEQADRVADGAIGGDRATDAASEVLLLEPEAVEGEPLLGRPTGLVALAGVGGRLVAVDLDRSTVWEYEATGQPMAVTGDRLVVERSSTYASLPLGDLGADSVTLGPTTSDTFVVGVVVGPGEREVWLSVQTVGPGVSQQQWLRYDAGTGAELAAIPLSDGAYLWRSFPSVTEAADYSVWTTGDDGVDRHLADGSLVAADWQRALVRTCVAPARCELIWYDLATGQAVAGPELPDLGDAYWADLVGDEVLLVSNAAGLSLVDLASGQVVLADLQTPNAMVVDVSADGRYLTVPYLDGAPAIHDRETGETFSLRSLVRGTTNVVLVPADAVGGPA